MGEAWWLWQLPRARGGPSRWPERVWRPCVLLEPRGARARGARGLPPWPWTAFREEEEGNEEGSASVVSHSGVRSLMVPKASFKKVFFFFHVKVLWKHKNKEDKSDL